MHLFLIEYGQAPAHKAQQRYMNFNLELGPEFQHVQTQSQALKRRVERQHDFGIA